MAHQKVLGQSQVKASEIYSIPKETNSITGYAHSARENIVSSLKENGFEKDELGIIKALLLGQKDDISKDTYNSYASAGVIHILAVSGLHVGLILAILQLLFRPLFRFKYGDYIKMGVIVMLLWGFAVLAGLSPSVVRAVTMFSFVAIAINLKRRTSTINTLFLSALLLLLINPEFLFMVGFQLSYLAVFSIVLLQPKLYGIFPRSKYWLVRLFWGVFTVTLSAQLGVLPLSLFYFHQFPGLFFVSNVVIIPVLGILLGFGILVILLSQINSLPEFLASAFEFVISTLNQFVDWVAKQEAFLFQDISFSAIQTLSVYALIIVVLLSLQQFSKKRLVYILVAVVVCQAGFLYEKHRVTNSEEFIVFHQTAETVLGFKTGSSLTLKTTDIEMENKYLTRTLNNYKVGEAFSTVEKDSLRNNYLVFGKHLVIMDSLGVYSSTLKPDMLLLRNSPRVNLNRLIDSMSPKQIIVDGSNYKSYVKRWKATAKRKKLPFHHTGEKGAFLIED